MFFDMQLDVRAIISDVRATDNTHERLGFVNYLLPTLLDVSAIPQRTITIQVHIDIPQNAPLKKNS